MKRKKIIPLTLMSIIPLLLTACNKAVTTRSIIEQTPQITEELELEQEQSVDWWIGKSYQAENNRGLYLWVDKPENDELNYTWFLIGTVCYDDNTCHVAARVDQKNISTTDEYIQYVETNGGIGTIIRYYPKDDMVVLVSENLIDGTYYFYSDTYLPVEENLQSNKEFIETPEFTSEPLIYECFETNGGWDKTLFLYFYSDGSIGVDIEGTISILLNPTRENVYEGYCEGTNSYIITIISGEELIFSGTEELEQYNGTYIQLPDLGTDGEN